ncbi:hypothetical protein GLW08_04205 [Pontibacillus yanchengensis]|uniref:Uncharacterized protein n=2 Tax=Pontibacillus yanchengensis TaxID=462910 RepID=A0ACC7VF20_9BACI|nr:hypothetical protein [Pontibacillus yanchengensis]MYL35094.1 hypothetical protein [Pontibacillus yanchengensis]MYL52539.1 hypothetical protein [Pontibacillus yanchengensis]
MSAEEVNAIIYRIRKKIECKHTYRKHQREGLYSYAEIIGITYLNIIGKVKISGRIYDFVRLFTLYDY